MNPEQLRSHGTQQLDVLIVDFCPCSIGWWNMLKTTVFCCGICRICHGHVLNPTEKPHILCHLVGFKCLSDSELFFLGRRDHARSQSKSCHDLGLPNSRSQLRNWIEGVLMFKPWWTKELKKASVDLVEISGGTYETMAMMRRAQFSGGDVGLLDH